MQILKSKQFNVVKYKFIICLVGVNLIALTIFAQARADDITGVWMTGGKEPAKIQVYKFGEKYYGKIVWLKNPADNGKPKLDNNNPDKSKRNKPIVGLVILMGFRFDGDDEWEDGDIYDPESGKTYSCNLSLKDKSTLKVRGYIGISLFGRTETWTKTNL
jgi:uncharacterized protein (DUF2147 family)